MESSITILDIRFDRYQSTQQSSIKLTINYSQTNSTAAMAAEPAMTTMATTAMAMAVRAMA